MSDLNPQSLTWATENVLLIHSHVLSLLPLHSVFSFSTSPLGLFSICCWYFFTVKRCLANSFWFVFSFPFPIVSPLPVGLCTDSLLSKEKKGGWSRMHLGFSSPPYNLFKGSKAQVLLPPSLQPPSSYKDHTEQLDSCLMRESHRALREFQWIQQNLIFLRGDRSVGTVCRIHQFSLSTNLHFK